MKKSNIKHQKFQFEEFFTGKVVAEGYMIFFYPETRRKKIKVKFTGIFKNKILKLKEEYFEDNIKTLREWQFRKLSKNKLIGNEQNVLSAFEVHVKNDFFKMSYKFKTKYKNLNFYVNVTDHMYVVNNNTLINTTKISKFLMPIAKTLLLYKKL